MLTIEEGNVTTNALELTGGNNPAGGSGINNTNGTVDITNTTITNNTTAGDGGAVRNQAGTVTVTNSTLSANTAAGAGGAIHNAGNLTVTDSTLTGNTATSDGGAISTSGGTASLTASTITNNTATSDGGGIHNAATLIVTDTALTGNDGLSGGAIHNTGTLTVTDTALTNNTATSDGGAISTSGGTATVTTSTITNNTATSDGGGIHNAATLIVTDTAITGNDGLSGGAISTSGGTTTLAASTITGNTATSDGGAINATGGTIAVTGSTISANTATGSGGGVHTAGGSTSVEVTTIWGNSAGDGGGVSNTGGTTTVFNSTISGNTASGSGGGINNTSASQSSSVEARYTTITNNTAATGAGILSSAGPNTTTTLEASIVATNNGDDLINTAGADTFASNGYNVLGTLSANIVAFTQPSDLTNADPQLGPLTNNGTLTNNAIVILTHLPAVASPAINRIPSATPGAPASDQRGIPRPIGAGIDAGSVEGDPCALTTFVVIDHVRFNTALTCYNTGTSDITIDIAADFAFEVAAPVIDNTSTATLTINGGGHTLSMAPGVDERFLDMTNGNIALNNTTLTGGTAHLGAAIRNAGTLTITDTTLTGNTGNTTTQGVVIRNDAGTLSINDTTISGNIGTGIVNFGTIDITGSTISNNTDYGIAVIGNTTITNTTISGNGESGILTVGALNGPLDIRYSTITNNSVGIDITNAATVTIEASIVADNGPTDVRASTTPPTSNGHNIIGTVNAGPATPFNQTGDLTNQDPLLGPLTNNGGPTDTHLPLPGSPAINHIPNTTPNIPTTDQRGTTRPNGTATDVGSIEVELADDLTLLASPCSATTGTLVPGVGQNITITGNCGVPATGVSAVVVSLASTLPTGPGNLRLYATGDTPQGGVVNYTNNGLTNANTITVPVSAGGQITVEANNSGTDFELRIIGYYSPAGTLKYTPVTPCAAADSRSSQNPIGNFIGPFAPGDNYPDIDLVGTFPAGQGGGNTTCGIPATADAVMINAVAVAGTGGQAGLAIGTGSTTPTQPTTFYSDIGLNNAASMIVPLNGGETIATNIIQLAGTPSSHIRIVVLGYYTNTGAAFTPTNPCAAFDTRTLGNDPDNTPTGTFAGKRLAGNAAIGDFTGTTTYNITGTIPPAQGGNDDCGVPEGATAVLMNLVGIQPDAPGNFRAYATGSNPTGGVLNFANLTPAMNNSNAIVIPLDTNGNLDLFTNAPSNAGQETIHARGVILGYYN